MKRLLILEHTDHIDVLERSVPKDIEKCYVAMTPHAAYELECRGISFKTPDQYYTHEEFWNLYPERTSRLLDLVVQLDRCLFQVDSRFEKEELKPFFLCLYFFKLLFDTVSIYIYWLNRIIKQEKPDEVSVVAGRYHSFSVDAKRIFKEEDSVCAAVLIKLTRKHQFKLKILPPAVLNLSRTNLLRGVKNWYLYQHLRDFKRHWTRRKNLVKEGKGDGHRVLNMDCRDLSSVGNVLREQGILIQDFPIGDFQKSVLVKREYRFLNELKARAFENAAIKESCIFEGVSYLDLILEPILEFGEELESFYLRYLWTCQFITVNKIDTVVTKSVAPFELENIIVLDAAKTLGVPHVTWMHGGYGGNYSFEGYDMTDFIFADYYLTYGDGVGAAIETYFPERSIGMSNLNKVEEHYEKEPLKIETAGAAFMEALYADYRRPDNRKKVILLIMGELWHHNQYYMGGNAPYTFMQKWYEMQKILKCLILFQDQYEIIIKLYPGDNCGVQMWQSFLDRNHGRKIKVIKNEKPIEFLLRQADLILSTWVSTTFFEAAFTDCDQFLYDPSDLTKTMRDILQREFYFSDDIYLFCRLLKKYLDKGIFYQKDKNEFREYYLDWSRRSERVSVVASILDKINATQKKEPCLEK